MEHGNKVLDYAFFGLSVCEEKNKAVGLLTEDLVQKQCPEIRINFELGVLF
jgi:hypothetical protein